VGACGYDVPNAVSATFTASHEVLGSAAKSRIARRSAAREFVRRNQPHRYRAVKAAAMLALKSLETESLDS
jgi:1,2-phenylacetyl-CoA epoxidase PaaB subunit